MFLVLITPFGIVSGYLSVAIAYLLSQKGVSVEQIAGLIAVSFVPQTWKFLWAPIADSTLTRKIWYVLAGVVTALMIFAMGVLPATPTTLPLLYVIALVASFASTFLAMATESLMVFDTPANAKGRAAGWFQAGNLGGGGVGGGAGLWMAQALPEPWMAGAVLAIVCVACCFALLYIREPAAMPRNRNPLRTMSVIARDLWSVTRSRAGALALLICFLPIGTGAASGLWSAVADDWHASANTVALVTGVISGLVSAAGCFLGGWACDRMDRKAAYALFGALLAICAIAMAIAPRTESAYIVFTMIYSLICGLSYAGFSAVTLEAIGHGAAATKYNVFASLSNMPIAYMTLIDGWAHSQWGAGGMLYTEAVVALIAIAGFYGVTALTRRTASAASDSAASTAPLGDAPVDR